MEALRKRVNRGRPLGDANWMGTHGAHTRDRVHTPHARQTEATRLMGRISSSLPRFGGCYLFIHNLYSPVSFNFFKAFWAFFKFGDSFSARS
jgi:hypothetical protein